MDGNWNILFESYDSYYSFDADEKTLHATLYYDCKEIYTYNYDAQYTDIEFETNRCRNKFISELKNNCDYIMKPDEKKTMAQYIRREFENYKAHPSYYKKSNNKVEYSPIVEEICNKKCYLNQHTINVCFDKVASGSKKLIPGIDRVPKNIDMLTSDGVRCYGKISRIEIFSAATKTELSRLFYNNEDNVIIAIESVDKSFVLAFILGYIGENNKENNDNRFSLYYKIKKVKKVDIAKPSLVFSLNDCVTYCETDSPLAPKLIPMLDYFNQKLSEANQEVETTKVDVNLKLLRENFEEFKQLAVDEDMIIVPVIGVPRRINGISILVKNNKGETIKNDIFDGILQPIQEDNRQSYLEELEDSGIILPKNTNLALLNLVNASDKEVFIIRELLTSYNSYECSIVNNIEGDKTRLKRIINGITNVLSGSVENQNLVNLICDNDIYSYLNIDKIDAYKEDKQRIERLRNEYPILAKNQEQLIAIDKILQMDENNVDIMLVQGPPGTGKTELILSLAKELYKSNYDTLITSNVHVACDNIVDRMKNNKDIVLKRYTATRGEQYDAEVIDNKKKYIENQVLEGFKFKDFVVDSLEKYDEIKANITVEENKKKQMMESREKGERELKEYNDLVNKEKKLQNELTALTESIEYENEVILESNQKQGPVISDFSSVEKKLAEEKKAMNELSQKFQEQNKKIKEKSDYLNELYGNINALEKQITSLQSANEKHNNDINDYLRKISELRNYQNFLNEFDGDTTKKVLISYAFDGIPFPQKYYDKLLTKSIAKVSNIATIYKLLEKDTLFWNHQANISIKTLEVVLKLSKSMSLFNDFVDLKSICNAEQICTFFNDSSFKHSMMNVFPFIKDNGHNKSYYEKCLAKISNELRKVQYSYGDYILSCINSELSKDVVLSECDAVNSKITNNNNLIVKSRNEILSNESDIKEHLKTIEDKKEIIKQFTSEIMKEKDNNNTTNGEITKLEELISALENQYNELKSQKTNLEKQIKTATSNINRDTKKTMELRSAIEDAKIKVERKYVEKQELIDNYDSFIAKMKIDIETIDKTIDKYTLILNSIDKKISELTETGWSVNEAKELLFDYANELEDIVSCNSKTIENIYFNGRGNAFTKMFLLSEKEDGSLISMTTNQIAKLFNSEENQDLTFDYIIIDEASKCSFEDLIISLPRVKHLVLIGDFMQLDPMYDKYSDIDLKYQNIFTPEGWDALNSSSFSMLLTQFVKHNEENNISGFDSNPYVAVMKRQYRMNKGIFNLISPVYSIHKGFELIDEKNQSANDVKCISVDGTEEWLDPSYQNTDEADAIVSFLEKFQENRDKYPGINTIGIITGYRGQQNLLRQKLKSLKLKGVQIGTFDRFQGREYDLAIISLVRTKAFGFTNNIRRMNVAFSRAKKHLLIFGNIEKLNKIAMAKKPKIDEGSGNISIEEDAFVTKTLIPRLYSLREPFVSINAILNFIKENDYE